MNSLDGIPGRACEALHEAKSAHAAGSKGQDAEGRANPDKIGGFAEMLSCLSRDPPARCVRLIAPAGSLAPVLVRLPSESSTPVAAANEVPSQAERLLPAGPEGMPDAQRGPSDRMAVAEPSLPFARPETSANDRAKVAGKVEGAPTVCQNGGSFPRRAEKQADGSLSRALHHNAAETHNTAEAGSADAEGPAGAQPGKALAPVEPQRKPGKLALAVASSQPAGTFVPPAQTPSPSVISSTGAKADRGNRRIGGAGSGGNAEAEQAPQARAITNQLSPPIRQGQHNRLPQAPVGDASQRMISKARSGAHGNLEAPRAGSRSPEFSSANPIKISALDQRAYFPPVAASTLAEQLASTIVADGAVFAPPDSAAAPSGAEPSNSVALAPKTPSAVKTLTLQLEPKSLGVVTISIKLSGERLQLQVEGANPDTVRLISENKDDLAKQLRASGYEMDAMVIKTAESPSHDSIKSGDSPFHPTTDTGLAGARSLASSQSGDFAGHDRSARARDSEPVRTALDGAVQGDHDIRSAGGLYI